jgi:hypothetical protein
MIIDSKSCDGDHDDEAAGRAWGGRGIVDLVTDYLILQMLMPFFYLLREVEFSTLCMRLNIRGMLI